MTADTTERRGPRAFVDLHCHTAGSFDSLADPAAVVRAAATRGLTHIAITDHDRVDGAVRARDAAPQGLTVIVGEEVKTADGDLICLFLERAVAPGRPALQTIAEVRGQGGMVGIPHPFDRFRGSMGKAADDDWLADIASQVDWVESYNARLIGSGNDRAAEFARTQGLPGIAVSDAHTVFEVGDAYSVLHGRPDTAEGLRAALAAGVEVIPGRASYLVRGFTPLAKLVQRARGNGRVRDPHRSSAEAAR
jgi:predicted metal-dependent phosphoesterase TrpH